MAVPPVRVAVSPVRDRRANITLLLVQVLVLILAGLSLPWQRTGLPW
jgi:hypothetical protein